MEKQLQKIEKLKQKQDINALITILSSGDYKERKASAEALGSLGNVSAIDPLFNALNDSVSIVAKEAMSALRKIDESHDTIEKLNSIQRKWDDEELESRRKKITLEVSKLNNTSLLDRFDTSSDELEVSIIKREIEGRGGLKKLEAEKSMGMADSTSNEERKTPVCSICGQESLKCHYFQFVAGQLKITIQDPGLTSTDHYDATEKINKTMCKECIKNGRRDMLFFIPLGITVALIGILLIVFSEDLIVVGILMGIGGLGMAFRPFYSDAKIGERVLKKAIKEEYQASDVWTVQEYKRKFHKVF